MVVAIESHQGAFDMQITTIGLDIAKNVFQVHTTRPAFIMPTAWPYDLGRANLSERAGARDRQKLCAGTPALYGGGRTGPGG